VVLSGFRLSLPTAEYVTAGRSVPPTFAVVVAK
jgi:hypothetical protein